MCMLDKSASQLPTGKVFARSLIAPDFLEFKTALLRLQLRLFLHVFVIFFVKVEKGKLYCFCSVFKPTLDI